MPNTAAFSSRSSRFDRAGCQDGPNAGDYDVNYHSMSAAAARAGAMPRRASFGGMSSRELPWQRPADEAHGTSAAEDAPVRSTFGSSNTAAVPSAAFAGHGDRFHNSKQATPGPGAYSSERPPLSPGNNRMNRSSSFTSRTKRFGMFACQDGPVPGQYESKPGAFASASQRSRPGSSGFGSRSVRASPFDVAHKEDAPPPPGAYDHSSVSGAFAAGGGGGRRSASPSAGFRSGSSRFGRTPELGQSGAAPGTYDAMAYHSMARTAGKSFNRASANGAGGFGTSSRRPPGLNTSGTVAEETPGPAAYGGIGATRTEASSRPSSAFASRSKAGEAHIRKSDGPTAGSDFDPHKATGIAASSAKSFNRLATSGRGLGPKNERDVLRKHKPSETPGPGAYADHADPSKPSCDRLAKTSRGRPSLWAASTSARDPGTWHERARPNETPGPGAYTNADPTRSDAYVKE